MELMSPWANLGFAAPQAWVILAVTGAVLAFNAAVLPALLRSGRRRERARHGAVQGLTAAAGLAIGFAAAVAVHLLPGVTI